MKHEGLRFFILNILYVSLMYTAQDTKMFVACALGVGVAIICGLFEAIEADLGR